MCVYVHMCVPHACVRARQRVTSDSPLLAYACVRVYVCICAYVCSARVCACTTTCHTWFANKIRSVCCSALQCVAVCCSVLQWQRVTPDSPTGSGQCVAVRCSVLQCVAVTTRHTWFANWIRSVRCSALQCVAVCCSDNVSHLIRQLDQRVMQRIFATPIVKRTQRQLPQSIRLNLFFLNFDW